MRLSLIVTSRQRRDILKFHWQAALSRRWSVPAGPVLLLPSTPHLPLPETLFCMPTDRRTRRNKLPTLVTYQFSGTS